MALQVLLLRMCQGRKMALQSCHATAGNLFQIVLSELTPLGQHGFAAWLPGSIPYPTRAYNLWGC